MFDLDEKFKILPEDIAGSLCIVVSTTQAFVKTATENYNFYRHNEHLEPHFAAIGLEPGMEAQKALSRLMPAAILGLTAMPGGDNNVLYSVYAQGCRTSPANPFPFWYNTQHDYDVSDHAGCDERRGRRDGQDHLGQHLL